MIDRSSGVPLYRLVADDLHERVKRGEWQPGQVFMSINQVATEYEISRNTAHKVMTVLSRRAVITMRLGDFTRIREAEPVTVVEVPPGHRVGARMPTERERADLDLPDGVPMLTLLQPLDEAGETWIEVDCWPADRTHLQVSE